MTKFQKTDRLAHKIYPCRQSWHDTLAPVSKQAQISQNIFMNFSLKKIKKVQKKVDDLSQQLTLQNLD